MAEIETTSGKSESFRYLAPAYFFIFAIFSVISPFLSIMVRGLGYSPPLVGILLAVFEAAGIAGPFILGGLADYLGRYKPGLYITIILMVIAGIPLALIRHPLASAFFLCLMAIGYRSCPGLMDAITTIIIGKNGNYGKIRSVGSIGFVIVVLILQWLPLLPRKTPLNIAIWLTIISAVTFIPICMIPSRYTETGLHPGRRRFKAGYRGTASRLWTPLLVLGIILIALSRFAMTPVNGFFYLYLVEAIQWDAAALMSAIAAASEVALIFFSGAIIRRFGSLRVLVFSSLIVTLRLLVYAFLPYRPSIALAQVLHAFCYGLFHPGAVAFISKCVPPERRALGMSLYISLGSGLPALFGNFIGGFIIEQLGYPALFVFFSLFPVLTLPVYFLIRRNNALL
jgi:PPP family 3-phenylpropionic acid transporter